MRQIKTNHPDLVDAKPIFGVLLSEDSGRRSTNIHIRYKGTPQDILKTRLQINWIKMESSEAAHLNAKKIAELADLYRQLKAGKAAREESILLPFAHQEDSREQESDEKREEFRYKGAEESLEEPGKGK